MGGAGGALYCSSDQYSAKNIEEQAAIAKADGLCSCGDNSYDANVPGK